MTASDSLQFRFGKDGDGNYGYYGADGSLIPFKSGGGLTEIYRGQVTSTMTLDVSEYKKTDTNGFIAVSRYVGIAPPWNTCNAQCMFTGDSVCTWDSENGTLTVGACFVRMRGDQTWQYSSGTQLYYLYPEVTVYYYD